MFISEDLLIIVEEMKEEMNNESEKKKSEKPEEIIPHDLSAVPKLVSGFGIGVTRETFILEFTSPIKDKRLLVGSFALGPQLAKKFVEILQEAVKRYEEEYGEIIVEEEKMVKEEEEGRTHE